MNRPSIEYLRSVLRYEASTGRLIWIAPTGRRAKIGPASDLPGGSGYLRIGVLGKRYGAHQIVWALAHGAWADGQIDHINGNRTDNRPSNLRVVSRAGNAQNLRNAKSSSAHGFLGVIRSKSGSRWGARIVVARKEIHLGYFATPEEAHAAYLSAKRLLHPTCTI